MNELSVTILSVGSPQLPFAIQSVLDQTIDIPYRIIQNVRPFGAAFNDMLSGCDSTYVIQLDEDMELHPGSAEMMSTRFKEQESKDPMLAQMVFRLTDPILGKILGVKIFAVGKASKVCMNEEQFPDRDFNQGLDDLGYTTIVADGEPVGFHARQRSEYEQFLKHAISASKMARPQNSEPAISDVRRFHELFKRSMKLDLEESIISLGGLYWGLFNDVRTDVATYPTETYNQLKSLAAPVLDYEIQQGVHDLVFRSNQILVSLANTESEPEFYTKDNYYGRNYRTVLHRVVESGIAKWDLVGFGFGEIALALHECGKLRGVHIDSSSRGRLKNPVAAKLNQYTQYCNPKDIAREALSSGIVIPNGSRLSVDQLEELLVENHGHAVIDVHKLEKCKIDSGQLIERLVQRHGWRAVPEENGVVALSLGTA